MKITKDLIMRNLFLVPLVLGSAVSSCIIFSHAHSEDAVADAYGVPVTQQDIRLHEAVGICAAHPASDASFWPEPCATATRQYEETGAKKKYDLAASNLRSMHVQTVTKAVGK
jgi:hypothetical protein